MASDPSAGEQHVISKGESLASIAKERGFLWRTLWEHGNNAKLKAKRKNPNQLVEGDVLFLPQKGDKQIAKPADARHRFKRRGEPTRLKLQMLDSGEPRRNEAFTLVFGDQVIHGKTDGDGKIDQPIPGETRAAALSFGDGSESYSVEIGLLDPPGLASGLQHRLNNLGFDCGGEDGDIGDATRDALLRFQRAQGLAESGEADDDTRARLDALHV
ncbi:MULTISPECIES: peptidoglycan-binding protein [unclassified Lysobacter]|uniref:peptidoglycan-binding domain-containing protein n=1 Tax=unclassified Lysobacter TaxID=2635362 RepID=UPI001BEB461F|nr:MULTISPECIES: peptidoglycan-binding protein [unclassified Lysobacter]MBT2744823.1 peptidoglycan-binding protein [Lysobacter sp. ISL-42]MBT2752184.1 peptidoglycan-binding protein [Lysobacter sp. ISL-50]MBT2778681.1 peptidoglycan-binding protein [Lysobacter sp. ISL-54]MBT2780388.1 peptidoglycan-binding protein [Lysobacter sp. ISL-52]